MLPAAYAQTMAPASFALLLHPASAEPGPVTCTPDPANITSDYDGLKGVRKRARESLMAGEEKYNVHCV